MLSPRPRPDELPGHPQYLRGVPSPLVRRLGSAYSVTAPLRAALYYHLGMDPATPVTESYPVWVAETETATFVTTVSLKLYSVCACV